MSVRASNNEAAKVAADPPAALSVVDTCDLCNKSIFEGSDIDEHVRKEHSTFVEFSNDMFSRIESFRNTPFDDPLALTFGTFCYDKVRDADKGKESFDLAIDARDQIQIILKDVFPSCCVYMFGSCVSTGSWDGVGDIDFTLVDPVQWDNGTWPDDAASIIQKAHKKLRRAGFTFEDLQPLLRTRVPIVKHMYGTNHGKSRADPALARDKNCRTIKIVLGQASPLPDVKKRFPDSVVHGSKRSYSVEFRTPSDALAFAIDEGRDAGQDSLKIVSRHWARGGYRPIAFQVDFDLSTLGFGVRNSWLLRAYLSQNHLVRCGSVFLKHWSKASGINNSKKGYLTSYAVNVMWIHYLIQTRRVSFVDPQSVTSSLDGKGELSYIPMVPSWDMNQVDEKNSFMTELGSLVKGFFAYYALAFNWQEEVITISREGVTKKSSLRWVEENEVKSAVFRERVWYRFCIEDPFEENLNLGRHVSPIKLHKVKSEFLFAIEMLLKGQWAKLLKDRSSTTAIHVCEKILLRELIGKTSAKFSTLIGELKKKDRDALAAFEVENATSSIFDGVQGLSVEGDTVHVKPDHRIPKGASLIVDQIDASLKQNPLLGAEATEEYRKYNLDTLFHLARDPFVRFFLTESDASKFKRYFEDIKMRLLDDEGNLDVQGNEHLEQEEAVTIEIRDLLMSTPFDGCEEFVQLVQGRVLAPRPQQPSAKASTRVERDRFRTYQGRCTNCRTNGTLWQTSDTAKDSGKYCENCWKKW